MDRARLLKHFDTLSDTPDAVAKLRELVLSLAIRGNLVPQQSSETQGKDWQAFLAKCDQAQPENGNLPPFDIPAAWRWAHLDDLADYRAAEKVEPSAIRATDWVLDLEEIEKDTSRVLRKALFKEKQSSSTKARFRSGDVLYGKLRPYLNKVVVAREAGYCTTEIVPIRSRGLIAPDYLCVFLRSPDFVGYTNEKSYGMKMPRLGTEDAEAAWIAVPPLAEQKRIVARVEELLALCDELEARQTAAREQRTRLVQSAFDHLTAAATPAGFRRHATFALQEFPHLTATPDSIPALRQAILSLAVQGRLVESSGSKSLGEKATFEPPIPCPSHWDWKQFGDLLESGPTNGFSPKPVSYPTKTKVLALSATTSGVFRSECFKYADLDVEEDSSLWLQDGDILIQRGNSLDYVGIAAVYDGAPKTFIYPDLMMKVRTKKSVNTAFAHLVLNSPFGREYFKSNASGTSGSMPKVNQATVRGFPFPIPPLAEQQRIVAKVAELMKWCDELEARLAAAQTAAAALLDSSLHALLAPVD